jgi:recombination protein RecT
MANINTGVAKKENGKHSLSQWLDSMRPQVERALPAHIQADRFLRVVLTTLRTNPKLAACEPNSFLAAMMTAAQLGLEINTPLGEAYIIPYKTEANFQIGYKGLLSLAYRTNQYRMIYAMEVYKNDTFSFEYGLEPKLRHVPAPAPEGEPTHYYAVYHLVNDGRAFRVWTREKVERHAQQFSQSYKAKTDSPWKSDFDSMAKKTVLIDLLRYAPKSIEFSRALVVDDTVRKDIDQDMDLVAPVEYEDDQTIEGSLTEEEMKAADEQIQDSIEA